MISLRRAIQQSFVFVAKEPNVTGSFNLTANATPWGLVWDGNFFWVVDSGSDKVFKYDTDGVYTGFSFPIIGKHTNSRDITTVNNDLSIVGSTSDTVTKWSKVGVDLGVIFSTSPEDSTPHGVDFDGVNFWVVGFTNKRIFKYDAAGVYTGFNFLISAQVSSPRGLTSDGDNLWVTNAGGGAFKFTKAGAYSGSSIPGVPMGSNGCAAITSNLWVITGVVAVQYAI